MPWLDTVFLNLPWQQIFTGNYHFLFQGITGEIDNLHPVQKWAGDGITAIGSGDKHNL